MPVAIRRELYTRDGGRCTYVDPEGRRCEARGFLELDHVEGYARTHEHRVAGMRLLCRVHNQHAAGDMYGKDWMDLKRKEVSRRSEPEPGPTTS